MARFEPAVQPTNVGVAGVVVTIPINQNYRDGRKINRVLVIPTAGSAASSTAKLGSDSTFAAREKQIGAWSGVTAAAPVDDDNNGEGFSWEPRDDASGNVYVKLVPDAGADNNYTIRIFIDEVQ